MTSPRARSLPHVRPVVPLHFPSEEPGDDEMGQSPKHYALCAALYEILRAAVGDDGTCACDAFVYFDASNPKRCLAPDGFVKLGGNPRWSVESWGSWKTWREGGAPELAIEILSPNESPERWTFEEKLIRYRALGVEELVVFFTEDKRGTRLRVWDRIDGDLVERVVENERTPCLTLGLHLVIATINGELEGLRLAKNADGTGLVPTHLEGRIAAEEGRRAAENAQRAAEERVRELERELAKKKKR